MEKLVFIKILWNSRATNYFCVLVLVLILPVKICFMIFDISLHVEIVDRLWSKLNSRHAYVNVALVPFNNIIIIII